MAGVGRVVAVDRLRGVIIALMALDHANALWSGGPRVGEFWAVVYPSYEQWLPAIIRWVTHLCAPGFFVLMGASIALAADSMRRRGADERTITRWFARRGLVLIVVQHLVVNPAWLLGGAGNDAVPGVAGSTLAYFGVLWSLGASMCVLAWARRLPSWSLVLAGCLIVLGEPALLPDASRGGEGFGWFTRLAYVPGQTGILLVRYPLLPWLGLACWGVVLGRALNRDEASAQHNVRRATLGIGVLFLATFVVLRVTGGYGNVHPWDGRSLDFLNVAKYPASPAFVTLTLGINALLFWLLSRFDHVERIPVIDLLGQSALFAYVFHLYLFGLIGRALPDTGYVLLLPLWVLGVLALVPACRRWVAFKRGTPAGSLWRMF